MVSGSVRLSVASSTRIQSAETIGRRQTRFAFRQATTRPTHRRWSIRTKRTLGKSGTALPVASGEECRSQCGRGGAIAAGIARRVTGARWWRRDNGRRSDNRRSRRNSTRSVVDALPPSLTFSRQRLSTWSSSGCAVQRGNRRRFVAGDGGNHRDGAGALGTAFPSSDLVKDAERKDVGTVMARLALGAMYCTSTAEPASYSRGWRTCPATIDGPTVRSRAGGRATAMRAASPKSSSLRTSGVLDDPCGAEACGKGGAAPASRCPLQVAMDDAGAMRPAERLADLDGNAKRVVERQPRRAAQSVRQRLAVEILEHQVIEIAVAADGGG